MKTHFKLLRDYFYINSQKYVITVFIETCIHVIWNNIKLNIQQYLIRNVGKMHINTELIFCDKNLLEKKGTLKSKHFVQRQQTDIYQTPSQPL